MPDQTTLKPMEPIAPELAEQDALQPPDAEPLTINETQLTLMKERDNYFYKRAKIYAGSDIVPSTYQNKPGNCFIAIQLANRMGVDDTFVMQHLYVVKGKPSWSGQACVSIINGCGMFKGPVKFNWVGRQGGEDWGCYCTAISKHDDELLTGALVDMNMVKGEGWNSNKKWQTMPQQMFMYRAASFFARVYCPNALMGFAVEGEAEDIEQAQPEKKVISIQ